MTIIRLWSVKKSSSFSLPLDISAQKYWTERSTHDHTFALQTYRHMRHVAWFTEPVCWDCEDSNPPPTRKSKKTKAVNNKIGV